ncbi:MAG: hypothetical protein PHT88_05050 [Candidatus Moranbacteria bacterium]|nr:hypothetical protein [Candidatus Moranbacteria bacterium]
MADCCEHHAADSGVVGIGNIFTPSFFRQHSPVGTVPMIEVEHLIRCGLLTECNVYQVYRHEGRAIGFICSDPSMLKHKSRLLNHRGNMSLWSKPAYGLRFDPDGPFKDGVEDEIREVQKFLSGTADHFNFDALIFGAHYPCGASGAMTLEQVCHSVAAGARHLGENIGLEVIPTIFTNTLVEISTHLPLRQMLLWWDINH